MTDSTNREVREVTTSLLAELDSELIELAKQLDELLAQPFDQPSDELIRSAEACSQRVTVSTDKTQRLIAQVMGVPEGSVSLTLVERQGNGQTTPHIRTLINGIRRHHRHVERRLRMLDRRLRLWGNLLVQVMQHSAGSSSGTYSARGSAQASPHAVELTTRV